MGTGAGERGERMNEVEDRIGPLEKAAFHATVTDFEGLALRIMLETVRELKRIADAFELLTKRIDED